MVPACPHCGSTEGYAFDHNKLEVDFRSFASGIVDNNGFVCFSMEVPRHDDISNIIKYNGDSVICCHCEQEIVDKEFIDYVVKLAQASVKS